MRILLAILLGLPATLGVRASPPASETSFCVYWTQGVETKSRLAAAGVTRVCVPAEQLEAWRGSGIEARAIPAAELTSREALATPGITARAGVASPTRAPWIVANGWQFLRNPAGKYIYDAPAGKAPLAAAEAFAYGADAVIKIDPADVESVGALSAFLADVPRVDLPPVADLGVVDDGSAVTGEVMNLLVRRNLLFEIVKAPSAKFTITVAVGSADYPAQAASDPSAFAQKIRQQLTDERRSLRIYGSEVVIARLTGTEAQRRLQLLNYGGRDIEGLRVRLRGGWSVTGTRVAGATQAALTDVVVADGATEFSIPPLATYAVIDLSAAK
jgi:hypothetical protein